MTGVQGYIQISRVSYGAIHIYVVGVNILYLTIPSIQNGHFVRNKWIKLWDFCIKWLDFVSNDGNMYQMMGIRGTHTPLENFDLQF